MLHMSLDQNQMGDYRMSQQHTHHHLKANYFVQVLEEIKKEHQHKSNQVYKYYECIFALT